MKIEVKLDSRRPFHGVNSVRGLWQRFVEGRRIIQTYKELMSKVGYRGDLTAAYDKLLLVYNCDLSHLQTVVALLGAGLAKKVCAVPEASLLWKKIFTDGKSEIEGFERARRPAAGSEACGKSEDDI